MQRNFSIKRFGGFFLACLLMMSPYLFAENDSEANEEIKKENKSYFKEEKIKILKNLKELIINPTQRTPQPSKKVDKLNVILKSIAGNEKDRYAVVEFEGEELTIRKDLVVKGKFKVIDIYPDRMVVYSFGEQRRHTYKITENEKINTTQKTTQPLRKVELLKVIVKSIAGNEEDRYAVVEFEGEEITIRKDQIVKGKFKVVNIYPDRVVVFSRSEQRRHTYKITEEKEINTTQKNDSTF